MCQVYMCTHPAFRRRLTYTLIHHSSYLLQERKIIVDLISDQIECLEKIRFGEQHVETKQGRMEDMFCQNPVFFFHWFTYQCRFTPLLYSPHPVTTSPRRSQSML